MFKITRSRIVVYIICFSVFLLTSRSSLGQSVGGVFGAFDSKSGNQIIQVIGQPYTNFHSSQVSNGEIHQGQILPILNQEKSILSSNVTVKIYPNPAIEFLNVQVVGSSGIQSVKFWDIQSKNIQLYDEKLTDQHRRFKIENLSDGVYFMELIDKDGNLKVMKFTKVKY